MPEKGRGPGFCYLFSSLLAGKKKDDELQEAARSVAKTGFELLPFTTFIPPVFNHSIPRHSDTQTRDAPQKF